MIDPENITGLVLAGGRGSRMGGVDKGLQPYAGRPLARHALERLRPQVGPLTVNANRHLEDYRAMGVPVWSDTLAEQPGPLAGFMAGLAHCATPYLVSVPCDSPLFPLDLVARLAEALEAAGADIALAATREADGHERVHPVFCLMQAGLLASLTRFTASGQRKVEAWTALHRRIVVLFDAPSAFTNANTLAELRGLPDPG